MKKLMLIAVLSVSMAGYGQWVTKSSCKKHAKEISNQAIEYMANLEYLTAFGLVKAALIVDENCGSAQLVHAAIASGSDDWGSRAARLKKLIAPLRSAVSVSNNERNRLEKSFKYCPDKILG